MKNKSKLELLEEILKTVNTALTPDDLLQYLIDRVIAVTDALTGSIMIINPADNILEIRVSRGLNQKKAAATRLKIGEGITGRAAQAGKPLIVNDAGQNPDYVRIRTDLVSELAAPMIVNSQVIGVISVDSSRKNAFNEEHADILMSIADFAAQTMEKIRLIENLRSRIDDQKCLLDIARILDDAADFPVMFESIMTVLSRHPGLRRGMIVLADEQNVLRTAGGYRLSEQAIKRGVYRPGEGIIGSVFTDGKIKFIPDISRSREFLNKMKIRRSPREKNSFFALPIKSQKSSTGGIIGVLSIEKKFGGENDAQNVIELLTIICGLIANRIYIFSSARKEKEELLDQTRSLKQELIKKDTGNIFFGKSSQIIKLQEMIGIVADTDATCLITGETGSGKEVAARQIHYKSGRWEKPFVGINCAAIPENLIEAELFGFKKGAFTGAVNDRRGKFLQADEGTLFLDEIGDLGLHLQAKLLRVIQEKTVEPLGSDESIRVNVRIIAATNKNLKEMAEKKTFREDLFYRLNVIHLPIPALRDRKEDIPLFIRHFLAVFNKRHNRKIPNLTLQAEQALCGYSWPGNIRELENCMERAVIVCRKNTIDIQDLPESILAGAMKADSGPLKLQVLNEMKNHASGNIYNNIITKVENILLEEALINADQNQKEASKYLGIHRNTLRQKIKELGL